MNNFSPSEVLSARLTALFRCSKNSLAVGELLARASSAVAKSGSSAMALSKCCRESWASSFSERSRPCKNSALASFDFVVIATLPASEEGAGFALALVLLHAVHVVTINTRVATKTERLDTFGYMAVPPLHLNSGQARKLGSGCVTGMLEHAVLMTPLPRMYPQSAGIRRSLVVRRRS